MMRAHNSAYRRYLKRMGLAVSLYLVTLFAAVKILHHDAAPSPLSIGLSLLPGLAVLAMLWSIARLLVELDDEFLRTLEVRKSLVATGVTLAVTSVWGLLEMLTTVPRLEVFWVFPIWCAGLTIGGVVNRVTMGAAGWM